MRSFSKWTAGDFLWFFFSPKGRIKRLAYVLGNLTHILVLSGFAGFGGLANLLAIPILYSSAIISIKRLHDRDHSGWYWLIMLIPFVNIVFFLYLLFAPSSENLRAEDISWNKRLVQKDRDDNSTDEIEDYEKEDDEIEDKWRNKKASSW